MNDLPLGVRSALAAHLDAQEMSRLERLSTGWQRWANQDHGGWHTLCKLANLPRLSERHKLNFQAHRAPLQVGRVKEIVCELDEPCQWRLFCWGMWAQYDTRRDLLPTEFGRINPLDIATQKYEISGYPPRAKIWNRGEGIVLLDNQGNHAHLGILNDQLHLFGDVAHHPLPQFSDSAWFVIRCNGDDQCWFHLGTRTSLTIHICHGSYTGDHWKIEVVNQFDVQLADRCTSWNGKVYWASDIIKSQSCSEFYAGPQTLIAHFVKNNCHHVTFFNRQSLDLLSGYTFEEKVSISVQQDTCLIYTRDRYILLNPSQNGDWSIPKSKDPGSTHDWLPNMFAIKESGTIRFFLPDLQLSSEQGQSDCD